MKYSKILTIAVLVLLYGIAISNDAPNDSLLTVVVVTTGGTIAEKYVPATGGVVPAASGDDLLAAVPGLSSLSNIENIIFSCQ